MEKTKEIRLRKLRLLIDEKFNGKAGRLADHVRVKRPQIYRLFSDKESRRDIGEQLARDIEARCGKPQGWMDTEGDAGITTDSTIKEITQLLPLLTTEQRARVLDEVRARAFRDRNVTILQRPAPMRKGVKLSIRTEGRVRPVSTKDKGKKQR